MSNLATYESRSTSLSSEVARQLCSIIAAKSSNLCVAVDLTKKAALLKVVDAVGPYVCMIKTHIDVVEDFDQDLIAQLQALSAKHNFLFFEDRKFADIGNTVKLQYSSGVYRIASWAHITNAHPVPGDGIITGLASVGLPLNRGLLLLAEMSSEGNWATGSYTDETVKMARRHKDFVIGFIAQRQVHLSVPREGNKGGEAEDFLVLSPGVGLDTKGDGIGQQYRTPEQVINESGCDVIIVGRGIYGKGDDVEVIQREAKRYQEAGWQAYQNKIKKQ